MIALFSYTVHGKGAEIDKNREDLRTKLHTALDNGVNGQVLIHDTFLVLQADQNQISKLISTIRLLNQQHASTGQINYFITTHNPTLKARGNPDQETANLLHMIGVSTEAI
ncbi:hypothetical protein V6C53_16070 [Desulfocurvibacter africanus]|uniref:hypothetical protein n=1 Tax=Desulfocurvibacter africanus TaxID=873 RepID=UPI002FD90E85